LKETTCWVERTIQMANYRLISLALTSCAGKSLPRFWPGDFFPVFYACHLAVLGVLTL
ncbi:hypothetical protein L3D03_24675, partial [Escherichia coli]